MTHTNLIQGSCISNATKDKYYGMSMDQIDCTQQRLYTVGAVVIRLCPLKSRIHIHTLEMSSYFVASVYEIPITFLK